MSTMLSNEARARLRKADEERATLQRSKRNVALHVTSYQRKLDKLDAVQDRPLDGDERVERAQLRGVLLLLRGEGIRLGAGIDYPELEPLVGVAGLAEHDRRIAKLDAEISG